MSVSIEKLFASAVPVLISIYAKMFLEADKLEAFPPKPIDYSLPQIKEYDFIIVGAGAAGSPLANKLSENFTVLLLEIGGDPIPIVDVPIAINYGGHPDSLFFNWTSTKQTNAALDKDGTTIMRGGKGLGGGTSINAMVYSRGSPNDYDNWARLTKDDSWNYENLLKYFKMSENFYDDENSRDGELGIGGPIPIVEIKNVYNQLYDIFMQGIKELGYPTVGNCNGPQVPGFGHISNNVKFGKRWSAYNAFLEPILNRNELSIVRYAEVTKVDIDNFMQAVGVHYIRHGVPSYAKARLEVILSAGAMNSPMILQRSGVGPTAVLKQAKIQVKKDLAVGRSLQNHVRTMLCASSNNLLSKITAEDIPLFLSNGKGPLTKSTEIGVGFIASANSNETHWPDIELVASTIPSSHKSQLCITTLLTRTAGSGTIQVDPKHPQNPGIWDPRYLENENDVKILAEGTQISSRILKTKVFAEHGLLFSKVPHPTCEEFEYDSSEYWKCFVHRTATSEYHTAGSCKMGSADDASAVVDTKLRVRGVERLRVIDNSVQPAVVNTNTMAAAIMIGQRGAHIISQQYAGRN